jgi:NADPH:quinone reductase-like Zn-dependent oxidoreductase
MMANESSIPKIMRAWVVAKAGNPVKVLMLRTDFTVPTIHNESDILIQIDHAALNPADIAISQILPTWLPFRKNPIPGVDFAGKVVLAGPSVPKEFAPGSDVCGCLGLKYVLSGTGVLAEYIVVDSKIVTPKPKTLSSAEASCLGITGQTVAIMLEAAKIKSGDRVLVNGGSGGVGTIAVQVAKGLGAHVTATCSHANIEMVRNLGADIVIDYKENSPIHAYFQKNNTDEPFDYILDTIRSQSLYEFSTNYLKPNGLFVNIGAHGTQWEQITARLRNNFLPTWLGGTPRKWLGLGLLPKVELQRKVCSWVGDGILKEIPIDSEVAFEDVRQVCHTSFMDYFQSLMIPRRLMRR